MMPAIGKSDDKNFIYFFLFDVTKLLFALLPKLYTKRRLQIYIKGRREKMMEGRK